MTLLERAESLKVLHELFASTAKEGRCVLLGAEAGMGKTSLLKVFRQELDGAGIWLEGSCDALFTPRPLGPVYDIGQQLNGMMLQESTATSDRSMLFLRLLEELERQTRRLIITIEDIHWADEATLDCIKFLGRRIHRLRALLVLTYRDNEISAQHPLRHVFGQLPPDAVTRLTLYPLSQEVVNGLSKNNGYDGEEVYRLTGGNPFYVTEIIQAGPGHVPHNVRDSVLSAYYKLNESCRQVLNLFCVLPGGLRLDELPLLEKEEQFAVQELSAQHILVLEGTRIGFRHELYRIAIETSLSPFIRIEANRRILTLFQEKFEAAGEIERIVHHAKGANDHDMAVRTAPLAAKKAAKLGAHIEAAKLYHTAIEYYQGTDTQTLLQFYEAYAYECYLTNQLKDAIIYETKALRLLGDRGNRERTAHCLNMLARIWWFDGHRAESLSYAEKACALLDPESDSATKAAALCGKAYLHLLADQPAASLLWGERALSMATSLGVPEIYCFALTPVAVALYKDPKTKQAGWTKLQQSLEIAHANGLHEQVGLIHLLSARADIYAKDYDHARKILNAALDYCENSELMLNTPFLLGLQAVLEMDLGNWKAAETIARSLTESNMLNPLGSVEATCVLARIYMRKGNSGVPELLKKVAVTAERMEPFFFVAVTTAYLEYEWITGERYIDDSSLDKAIAALSEPGCSYPAGEFVFWYRKARQQSLRDMSIYEGYDTDSVKKAKKAASLWHAMGCPYEEALALFDSNEEDKRKALELVDRLHATAVFEKMKFLMRADGVRKLPRGIRASTRANDAHLTKRELDVLSLLREGLGNKEIAGRLFLSPKTVDHHISSILFKLDVSSRIKAVKEAERLNILN